MEKYFRRIYDFFLSAVEKYIAPEMTKKQNVTYQGLLRQSKLIRRHGKLSFHARQSNDPDIKSQYKRLRAHAQKIVRDEY